MTILTDFAAQLRPRPVSLMQLGGFRPTDNPFASWFGRVRVSRPNESHPMHGGEPMLPLCQINCAELPYHPPSLADIRLLTVFIAPDELPMDTANGDGWLLRAYTEQDELIPIVTPEIASPIKAFPIRYELGAADYPCQEDAPVQVPDEYDDSYDDLFPNYERSKVGGYPTLIQGELYWSPYNRHPANPEYIFQINSEEKADWWWGDNGIGYFGRGTGTTRDVWTMTWTCY